MVKLTLVIRRGEHLKFAKQIAMIQEPNCHKRGCKHYLGVAQPNDEEKGEKPVCSAYPDGIPEDIAYGSDKHLEVRKDQTGNYVFENEPIKNVL